MEENTAAVSDHQETIKNWMSHVCKPSPLSRIFYLKKLSRNMPAMKIVISLNKCEKASCSIATRRLEFSCFSGVAFSCCIAPS
jgi:hypothetical protein